MDGTISFAGQFDERHNEQLESNTEDLPALDLSGLKAWRNIPIIVLYVYGGLWCEVEVWVAVGPLWTP